MWLSQRKKEALERARQLEKDSIPEMEEVARQYKEDLTKEIKLARLLKDDWYLHEGKTPAKVSRRKNAPAKKRSK